MLENSNKMQVIGVKSRVLYSDGSSCEYDLHHAFITNCVLVNQGTKKLTMLSIAEIGNMKDHKYFSPVSEFSNDVVSGTYYGIILERGKSTNVNENLINVIGNHFDITKIKHIKAYLVLNNKFSELLKGNKDKDLDITVRVKSDLKGSIRPSKEDGVFIKPLKRKESDSLVIELCGEKEKLIGVMKFSTNGSVTLKNPDNKLYKEKYQIGVNRLPKKTTVEKDDNEEE